MTQYNSSDLKVRNQRSSVVSQRSLAPPIRHFGFRVLFLIISYHSIKLPHNHFPAPFFRPSKSPHTTSALLGGLPLSCNGVTSRRVLFLRLIRFRPPAPPTASLNAALLLSSARGGGRELGGGQFPKRLFTTSRRAKRVNELILCGPVRLLGRPLRSRLPHET